MSEKDVVSRVGTMARIIGKKTEKLLSILTSADLINLEWAVRPKTQKYGVCVRLKKRGKLRELGLKPIDVISLSNSLNRVVEKVRKTREGMDWLKDKYPVFHKILSEAI